MPLILQLKLAMAGTGFDVTFNLIIFHIHPITIIVFIVGMEIITDMVGGTDGIMVTDMAGETDGIMVTVMVTGTIMDMVMGTDGDMVDTISF